MRIKHNKVLALISVLILFIIFGCAGRGKKEDTLSKEERLKAKKELARQEAERVKKVFEGIRERRKPQKSEEWLSEAYKGIKLKRLTDIPREEYGNYKRYLHKDNIYIIVHPNFHLFFIAKDVLPLEERSQSFPSKNLMERVYEKSPEDINIKVINEQEENIRDFLEFMSVEKKLVILILPGDYRDNLSYGYIPGLDEYARYINEITYMSESVIYIESKAYDNGFLNENDLETLETFLKELGIRRVMLGGGYVGKCLDNFYSSIRKKFNYEKIYFVPELLSISPIDMVGPSRLLTKKGRMNFKEVMYYFRKIGIETEYPEKKPRFIPLPFYNPYNVR